MLTASDAGDPIAEFGPTSRFQVLTPLLSVPAVAGRSDEAANLSLETASPAASAAAAPAPTRVTSPTPAHPAGFLGFLGGLAAGLVHKRASAVSADKELKYDLRVVPSAQEDTPLSDLLVGAGAKLLLVGGLCVIETTA